MKFEFSAGGIVYKKDPALKFLLIQNKTLKGELVWALPKGHIEKGEEVEATAEREVQEETGIQVKTIERLHNIEYFFKLEGELIKKKVYFLLMEYKGGEIKPQTDEIEDASWFAADEALNKMSYDNEREVVKKAIDAIEAKS